MKWPNLFLAVSCFLAFVPWIAACFGGRLNPDSAKSVFQGSIAFALIAIAWKVVIG